LAGIPRRIPDYADAYAFWNEVARYGSIFTNFSIIFFFYIVYVAFYRDAHEEKSFSPART
jgi:cytochrome c oxidase subunit 1